MIHRIETHPDSRVLNRNQHYLATGFYDDETDTLYMGAGGFGPENIVTAWAIHDVTPMYLDGNHVYLPTEWLIETYPNPTTKLLLAALKNRVRKQVKEIAIHA